MSFQVQHLHTSDSFLLSGLTAANSHSFPRNLLAWMLLLSLCSTAEMQVLLQAHNVWRRVTLMDNTPLQWISGVVCFPHAVHTWRQVLETTSPTTFTAVVLCSLERSFHSPSPAWLWKRPMQPSTSLWYHSPCHRAGLSSVNTACPSLPSTVLLPQIPPAPHSRVKLSHSGPLPALPHSL